MAAKLQVTIDCANTERLVRFWSEALGYAIEPPPDDFPTWRASWLAKGISEEELGTADWADSVVDPAGIGPGSGSSRSRKGTYLEPTTTA